MSSSSRLACRHEKQLVAPVSTSLTAAALQEHLSRQLSLSLSDPISLRPHHPTSIGHNSRRGHAPRAGTARRRQRVERGLEASPPPLSLAQRMGLVERPRDILNSQEWGQVKMISRERGDSSQPCPVCQEEFGLREQVLLSCSHVFHRQCLRSVERFSGKKTCPLCRTTDYQTRVIADGKHYHRIKAATVIQSWWRGVRVQRWYKGHRDRVPPSHPTLRVKYYRRRLASLTDKMVASCDQRNSNADSILAAADSALAIARTAMRIFDRHAALTAVDWTTLRCRAIVSAPTAECPICIAPILHSTQAPPPSPAHYAARQISLLSCGHLIHLSCVTSLEKYCTEDSNLPLCPLCRDPYHRQTLVF